MAVEAIRVYRFVTGSGAFPATGNFTAVSAGIIRIDDSNGSRDSIFDDFSEIAGNPDIPDQNVTSSTVAGISVGDTIDSRYRYTITGSDGSTGTVYIVATNGSGVYGQRFISTIPIDPTVTYTFGIYNRNGGVNYSDVIQCFARGTRIETETGPVRVEDLAVGDRVLTRDDGYQQIRWIGSRHLDAATLAAKPKLRPILIGKGAMGDGVPANDLRVSPQHRMLVRSAIARRMFDTDEVLIPANKLVGIDGITGDDSAAEVEYFHILLDTHHILMAEGAPSESLLVGPQVVKNMSADAREELVEIFGEGILTGELPASPARTIPQKGRTMRNLVRRHNQNGKPLMDRAMAAAQ